MQIILLIQQQPKTYKLDGPDKLRFTLAFTTPESKIEFVTGLLEKLKGKSWLYCRRIVRSNAHLSDDYAFSTHCDYIHYNPIIHGLDQHPAEWPSHGARTWIFRKSWHGILPHDPETAGNVPYCDITKRNLALLFDSIQKAIYFLFCFFFKSYYCKY